MLGKTLDVFDKLINAIMVIFFLLLLLIGGYAFFDSYNIYNTTKLDSKIANLKPSTDEDFTFSELREINPDIDGWLTIFQTTIDYPIVHSKDNLDYLNLDYRRNYTTGGSIFSDYRNSPGFKDDYTILYGHNMATGQMFSDVKRYENNDYFHQHLYGALYTEDNLYKLEVMEFAKVNAYEDDIYNLITYINGRNAELAELVNKKSLRTNVVDGHEKLILLSTCDSYGSNDRTVLLVKATGADETEIKAIEQAVKENLSTEPSDTTSSLGIFAKWSEAWWIVLVIILMLVLIRAIKQVMKKS